VRQYIAFTKCAMHVLCGLDHCQLFTRKRGWHIWQFQCLFWL